MLRLLAFAALFASAAVAAQPLTVGSSLPAEASGRFAAADGSTVNARDLMGENGLVVAFWSNVCPWTERYAPRLAALARDYVPAGIGFVAVNANDSTRFPEENRDGMQRTAAEHGFTFPYIADEGNALATAFGARNAPQVYFFDAAGVLLYAGAIDDSPADAERVEDAYLREAMDLHLAGQPLEVRQTNAIGCTLKTR